MDIQYRFGVDIAMVLDECTPFPATKEEASASMELSMKWAKRCRDSFSSDKSALFGIVQGGMYEDLREESLETLKETYLLECFLLPWVYLLPLQYHHQVQDWY